MARLSIRLLGPVQIRLDGQPVTGFETKKGLALLAFLAVEGDRPHRREALAEMLWPGRPEGAARANLRHTLAKLRTAIGDREAIPPTLLANRDTVQFNPASDVWLDVSAFSTLLPAGQAAEPAIARKSIGPLEKAVELYRGALLEDVSVPDSVAFEEWLLLKREQFGRQALDALRLLAERHEQIGEVEQALEYVWRQVELAPWQETAQRRAMRLLAISGRRDAALAQYQACRRILAEELEIEPEEETVALYQRIRDEASPVPARATPVHNLPVPLTPFVGRREELAALQDHLLNADCRLLTLVGPGGIGKTRLALAAGALLAEKPGMGDYGGAARAFIHGIVFVPLAPSGSADDIVPAIAEACGLRLERGQEQLFDYLRQKRLLLILDNLEHLLEGGGVLAEILRAAPGVRLLATSRERLQLQGEQVFPLHGLAFPDQDPAPATLASVDVDSYVASFPAVELFVGSARRVQPGFAPGPDDLAALARICRLVEGMPLALELAASWADTLALNDILVEIKHSLDFLQTKWRDIPRRQRSVRAVFDASWGQLGHEEQALFPRFSVFRGGFTRVAAAEIAQGDRGTATLTRLLSRLVTKSFLRYDQAHDRYQVHELLRQYGVEKLAHSPSHEAKVRDRHSLYFCRWLRGQGADLKNARQQAALNEIATEIENLRAACNWAASQGQAERLSETLGALGLFYDWRKEYQAGEITFKELAERLAAARDLSSTVTGITQRAMARVLMWRSKFNGMMGKSAYRLQLVREGLAHLDSPLLARDDTRLERAFLGVQFAYAQDGVDTEAQRELFARSFSLYEELGDCGGQANALMALGRVARTRYAHKDAKEAFASGLALREAMGDHIGSAKALALLSDIALRQGQFAEAERLIRESLATTRDAIGVLTWAYTLICTGRFVEAKTPAAESLALFTDQGARGMACWAFLDLSHIHQHLGDYLVARVQAKEALSLARQVGSDRQTGFALAQLGAVQLAEGGFARARERCEESLVVCQEVLEHPNPRAILGLAARELGHRDEARQHFLAQLRWAVEYRSFFPLVFALAGIALLLADAGQAEPAVEVYALAARHPFVARSQWFQDVAGREMVAVAAQLPPQTAADARTRGRSADLWPTADDWLERLSSVAGARR